MNEPDPTPDDVLGPAFQPGRVDNATALVLAAPGAREAEAGRPAAGKTGENLDAALVHLHRIEPAAFPWLSRLDYRIVNAVSKVLRKPRSMPYDSEIKEAANVERLRRQLRGFGTVVALSPKAVTACRIAGVEPDYCAVHPGDQGINPLLTNFPGSVEEAIRRRILLYAELLIASRGRCDDAIRDMLDRRQRGLARRSRGESAG